jgi:Tfp pilus assembly protein PilV
MLEVVIAMAVVGLALLSVLGLLMSSSALKQSTRELTLAQEIAAGEIERLKGYPEADRFDELPALDGTNIPLTELNNGTMLRAVDNNNPNLLRITITITWTSNGLARAHSETLIVTR